MGRVATYVFWMRRACYVNFCKFWLDLPKRLSFLHEFLCLYFCAIFSFLYSFKTIMHFYSLLELGLFVGIGLKVFFLPFFTFFVDFSEIHRNVISTSLEFFRKVKNPGKWWQCRYLVSTRDSPQRVCGNGFWNLPHTSAPSLQTTMCQSVFEQVM